MLASKELPIKPLTPVGIYFTIIAIYKIISTKNFDRVSYILNLQISATYRTPLDCGRIKEITIMAVLMCIIQEQKYRIFRHIRRTFFHLKICLKNGMRPIRRCVLYAAKFREFFFGFLVDED
jgi:hypothetical protein